MKTVGDGFSKIRKLWQDILYDSKELRNVSCFTFENVYILTMSLVGR